MHIHLTLSYWTFFQHQTTGSRVRKTSTSDLFLECLMPLSMFRCVYHFSDTVSTPVRLFMSISISLGVQLWQICGKWQNHRSSTNCLRCSLTAWHLAEIVCSFKMQLVVGRSRNDFFFSLGIEISGALMILKAGRCSKWLKLHMHRAIFHTFCTFRMQNHRAEH